MGDDTWMGTDLGMTDEGSDAAFWVLLVALGVAWAATTAGEERWWGLAVFGLVSGVLALANWIGEDGGKP